METPIDWLQRRINTVVHLDDLQKKLINHYIMRAKAMERTELIEAFEHGYNACDLDEALEINQTMFSGERYYNDHFNQNK